MKKKIAFLTLLSFIFFTATSLFIPVENIQIRVFAHIKVNSVQVYAPNSGYRLIADGNVKANIKAGIDYRITVNDDCIEVRENEHLLGCWKYLRLVGESHSELRLKTLQPDRKVRTYQNNMSFSVMEGGLRMINDIVLDNYIAGVTEAEAGSRSTLEFYKIQAILARTFALSHINKHVTEGFSLCDQVHCQAYYGKPRDLNVFKAIEETKGKVVVDENLNLIVAAFHSNSGGQTANSEDVWGAHTPYLRSIADTFSIRMPNYRWERRMLAEDWLSYLKLKHNFPVETDSGRKIALSFNQDTRKSFIEYNNAKVPLRNVRQDLQLKSTFFSISRLGTDSILISGKGYGHGLGMCQEGAMCMVKRGYNYMDVLNFYYQNVRLIDLQKLSFFRDE